MPLVLAGVHYGASLFKLCAPIHRALLTKVLWLSMFVSMSDTSQEPYQPRTPRTVLTLPADFVRLIKVWRQSRRVSPGWTVAVALISSLVLLPIITVGAMALLPTENIWPHLMRTVLPRSLYETLFLLCGVGLITGVAGTMTAWVVTMYRFPGRDLVDRLLVLPLAVPTYIVAYCYVELLDFAGPVQSWLRTLFGWQTVRDYWFPDIRTLPGAVLLMSAVLYPYVYLSARASFVQQSVCALEVARTLGRTPMGTLWSVALPLARPAIAAGMALGLMECLNDLGAVQHLGVQTLTYSVYATWLQRSNLGGAAQIAVVMLIFVALLFWAERSARGNARFHHTTSHYRAIPFSEINGWQGYVVAFLCCLPFCFGFAVPFLLLLNYTLTEGDQVFSAAFWQTAWHSLVLASIAAIVTVVLAVVLAYARRIAANGFTIPAVQLASLGYALPGTVLALGLLYPLAAFDNGLDEIMRSLFGLSTGLLLSGSLAALVLAYVIRFIAVAIGSIDSGFERASPNLDAAARTLGAGPMEALRRVHLPLLMPALGAAALLVFVETMKELPSTLLLRPFNFETLATHVYALAALERFEEAAFGALMIVALGLLPILLLHEAIARGRRGGKG